MSKRVFLKTFGCQMNERDSELIAGMLMDKGIEIVSEDSEADVILYNTCSVRQHAEDRVVGNLQRLAMRKKKRPELKIGVLGCMAQRHGELLMKEFPQVDIVIGPSNIYNLPELIDRVFNDEKVLAVDNIRRPKKGVSPEYRTGTFSAFVNVMYGCDNYCSYCIVPHVRGREVSRPKKDIVKEIKMLRDRGFKEITLLGQNVNSYGKGQTQKINFTDLLEAANDINGIERIRFTTSHPKDAGKSLFRAMRDLDKVCEHIHLPVQSGSDKILDLMNRKYTVEEYRSRIDLLRSLVPGVAISTDIIVGFPSERQPDYEETYKVMEDIKYNSAFVFKYSPRPPAVSSFLVDDVSEDEKKKRNNELLELQKEISLSINKSMVGSIREVLVEGPSRMSDKELVGRTRNNTSCVFPGGDGLAGKIVNVRIKDSSPYTLKGEIVVDDEKTLFL